MATETDDERHQANLAVVRRRAAALSQLHEAWLAQDRPRTPHRHVWREVVPEMSAHLEGAVLRRITAGDGSVVDAGGTRSTTLDFRLPDGREVSLHVSVASADWDAPAAPGDFRRDRDEDVEGWAGDGTGVELLLYDPAWETWRAHKAGWVGRNDGPALEPPTAADQSGFLEVVVPASDDWWDDTTTERFEALAGPAEEA